MGEPPPPYRSVNGWVYQLRVDVYRDKITAIGVFCDNDPTNAIPLNPRQDNRLFEFEPDCETYADTRPHIQRMANFLGNRFGPEEGYVQVYEEA